MLNQLKFYISIISARIISLVIHLVNKTSGTSFVGLVVLKICPDFLKYCKKYVRKEVIAITGTNGKTTTAGVLSSILEYNNQKIVHNSKGANMLTGIANVLSLKILPFKKYDYYVLESDEAYLTKLFDYLPANQLLVTNLFRDQLDRYGELDTTAKKIQEAIDKNANLKLFLNADDPMVSNLGNKKNKIFFGFETVEIIGNYFDSNSPVEAVNCPLCGENLNYNQRFFAQQGDYYCNCGYKRPKCHYCAEAKVYENHSELNITSSKGEYKFRVEMLGLYNAYNALGAISIGLEMGYSQQKIQNALNSYEAIFGRAERLTIDNHEALIQLIKNPTGASEVLKTVDLSSNIIIIINDNYADGRDVSWLWDADFEVLKDAKKQIYVSGQRAQDMAVRLKYAGVEGKNIVIIPEIKEAINHVTSSLDINENITILPTYTSLLKMQNIIKE